MRIDHSIKSEAAITTSWDDGHPLDQRVAELLAKYGLNGTFYTPLQNIRPVMTGAEIRQLSETFEIGAHTVDHVVLTEVSQETAEWQIRESKMKLEHITGKPCEAFCFPKGRFRRSHIEMVSRAGFRCVRTVELLSTRFPKPQGDIYIIPTTIQACPHHWSTYANNCAKRVSPKNFLNLVSHIRFSDWTETAKSLLQYVARCGGVFHLWGHSWEIDERQQWPQLEAVFSAMQELSTPIDRVPNSQLVPLDSAWSRSTVS